MTVPDSRGGATAYVIETSSDELDRLTIIADMFHEHVIEACRRAGIGTGARVVDVGCGAPGALLAFAEVVGPMGRVTGIDMNPEALRKAGEITRSRGLDNIDLVQADVHDIEQDGGLRGRFDVAYARVMLMHQPDPARTLRAMASLVRAGGLVLTQDTAYDHPTSPISEPPVPAVARWFELLPEAMRSRGSATDVAWRLDEICRAAGLEQVSQRFYLAGSGLANAPTVMEIMRLTLLGIRRPLIDVGLSTPEELDELGRALMDARTIPFRWFTGVLHSELIAHVPDHL